MNRNNFWRFILVVLVVVWAVYELYPPKARDLVQVFRERAVAKDTNFNAIVQQALEARKGNLDRSYEALREAVSTNDLTKYFPFFDAKNQTQPNYYILNRLQREAAGRIRLGLDLQGGTSFLVQMDTSSLTNAAEADTALSQAVEVLRKRVDRFGVAEPLIQPAGSDKILVQLPGLSAADHDSAKNTISKAAYLEFRMVHPQSRELIAQGLIEPGYEVMRYQQSQRDGRQRVEEVLVRKRAEMDGSSIRSAMVVRNNIGEPEIDFTLSSDGTEKFGAITRENVGRQLAIILDGVLYSAPVIRQPIETGRGQISGQFDLKEALELANALENPLKAPLKILYSNDVDPTLGLDSIQSGLRATIYGTLAVVAFMAVFYFFVGLVANFALCLNIVITLGILCSIGSTLTLPGIAGLMLSTAMAVDANVLIYERIREELAAGKSLRGALSAGYSRAFGTIFDSNLTTLITSVILIYAGTGPIKGFGVTLTIGVGASLFTALVVTRLIFDFLLSRNILKSMKMLPLMKLTKVDFIAFTKPAAIISLAVIIGGLGYGVFVRGHKILGVDFAGGDALMLRYAQRVDVDELRNALGKVGLAEATIQYQKPLGGGTESLTVTAASGSAAKVEQALVETFPQAKFERLGLSQVGPVVGKEIQRSAIVSALLAMFGILVYVAFRYEFSFAVAAVVATAHDALFTVAVFLLVGGQFTSAMVAAVLTIIGYSINDKIVILDRIREDLRLGVHGSFRDLINLALNQTLSRTLITGGSVILATLSLYIFGGSVINDFAFVFLVGILTGTYSSIYIASMVILAWHKGHRPQIGPGAVQVQGAAPARA